MSYQIQLQADGQTFSANEDQTVLDAALEACVSVPYGCRAGVCGACKGKVVSGTVELAAHSAEVLPESAQAEGYTLLCCARPKSDLVLDVPKMEQDPNKPQKMPARVARLERLTEDVMRVDLQLPASETFSFRAGQYIDISIGDHEHRSFSIANSPEREGVIELHIRLVPGGKFTTHVFNGMKARDILRIKGPLGSFFLREDSDKPIVLLAGGTGFAPLKGIVEHALHVGIKRPISLYWGSRTPTGFYMHGLAQSWQSALSGFRYIPVVSDSRPDDGWTGRRGMVHEAVLADFADLSQHEVYACGAPAMIDAARRAFTQERGLPEDAFFSDAFTFAAPPPPKD
ncbi:MAG: CDP-6-deoxy-delta-3,4-glucoseen reductase [Azoarcus sp.]|jgi:CDP-4-dehydro-6-deoxyglucose reductase|nr:CDP-6-deoxy-delta-3,4-glucoseen reductase [Azoarcus sp.]